MNWDGAKRLVVARDGGKCLRCLGEATDVHHRRPRQMGGTLDEDITVGLANLISLCRDCHNWVHTHPAHAYQTGMLLKSGQDPALTALHLFTPGIVMLTPDGRMLVQEACALFLYHYVPGGDEIADAERNAETGALVAVLRGHIRVAESGACASIAGQDSDADVREDTSDIPSAG